MEASVTYRKLAPEKVQEEYKKAKLFEEESKYKFYVNLYSLDDKADLFISEAKSKLDNSMKGWIPKANGTETHYQIHPTKDGVEYSYTRYYTK